MSGASWNARRHQVGGPVFEYGISAVDIAQRESPQQRPYLGAIIPDPDRQAAQLFKLTWDYFIYFADLAKATTSDDGTRVMRQYVEIYKQVIEERGALERLSGTIQQRRQTVWQIAWTFAWALQRAAELHIAAPPLPTGAEWLTAVAYWVYRATAKK